MRTHLRPLWSTLAVVSAALALGCPIEGPPGPTGARGDPGPTGPTGPTGEVVFVDSGTPPDFIRNAAGANEVQDASIAISGAAYVGESLRVGDPASAGPGDAGFAVEVTGSIRATAGIAVPLFTSTFTDATPVCDQNLNLVGQIVVPLTRPSRLDLSFTARVMPGANATGGEAYTALSVDGQVVPGTAGAQLGGCRESAAANIVWCQAANSFVTGVLPPGEHTVAAHFRCSVGGSALHDGFLKVIAWPAE